MRVLIVAVLAAFAAFVLRRVARGAAKSLPYAPRRRDIITHAALLATFRYLASVAFLVALSATAVLLIVWGIQLTSRGSFAATASFLAFVRAARDWVDWADTVSSRSLLIILVPLFAVLVYRAERKRIGLRLDASVESDLQRVLTERAEGRWEHLPQTEPMKEISAKIRMIDEELQAIAREPGLSRPYTSEQLLELRVRLEEQLDLLDVDRRLTPQVDLSVSESGPRVSRFFTALVSEGMLTTLSGATRMIVVTGTLLFVPSLVGVEMTKGLDRPLDIALARLTVSASVEAAEKSIERASAKTQSVADAATNDDEAIDAIARHYDMAWQTSGTWTPADTAPVPLRRDAEVRRAILDNWAAHARKSGVDVHAMQTEGGEALYKAAVNRMDASASELGTGGRRMREMLRKLVKEHPAAWREVKASLADYSASFGRMAERRTVNSLLFSTAFDEALGRLGDAKGLASQAALDLISDVTPEIVEAASESRANDFLATLVRGEGLDKAAAAVQRMPPHDPLRAIVAHAATAPAADVEAARAGLIETPSLQAREISNEKFAEVRTALKPFSPRSPDAAHALADVVTSFEDYFPSSSRTATKTPQYELLQTWLGSRPEVESAARVSRNATLLHGSKKIGGVIIGVDPAASAAPLDFVDLDWVVEGKSVQFSLRRSDGVRFPVGPFRTSIAAQALAYAADGRPTAVTIKNSGLAAQRVLLHPVLLDSPLGCRTVALDRLIFDHIKTDAELANVRNQHALFQYAYAIYDWKVPRRLAPHDYEKYAQRQVSKAEAAIEVDELKSSLTAIGTTGRSPITSKPDRYDVRIARALRACGASRDMASLRDCLVQHARTDQATDLLAIPDLDFVSGVREAAYRTDPDLAFLRPSGSSDVESQLWPFEFLIQAVYADADPKPWQFSWMRGPIMSQLLALAQRDPAACAEIRDLQEFTIAQRLFRTILAGQMGRRFPMEKLAQLARAITPSARVGSPTPRWTSVQPPGDIGPEVAQLRAAVGIEERSSELACAEIGGASLVRPLCATPQ